MTRQRSSARLFDFGPSASSSTAAVLAAQTAVQRLSAEEQDRLSELRRVAALIPAATIVPTATVTAPGTVAATAATSTVTAAPSVASSRLENPESNIQI